MGERDFQQEVIDRLARIETKQDMMQCTVGEQSKMLADHSVLIEGACNSASSAHKRLDGICATAGLLGSLAGGLVQLITWLMPSKGGH